MFQPNGSSMKNRRNINEKQRRDKLGGLFNILSDLIGQKLDKVSILKQVISLLDGKSDIVRNESSESKGFSAICALYEASLLVLNESGDLLLRIHCSSNAASNFLSHNSFRNAFVRFIHKSFLSGCESVVTHQQHQLSFFKVSDSLEAAVKIIVMVQPRLPSHESPALLNYSNNPTLERYSGYPCFFTSHALGSAKCLSASHGCQPLIGYTPNELVEKDWYAHFNPNEFAAVFEFFTASCECQVEIRCRFLTKSGRWLCLLIRRIPNNPWKYSAQVHNALKFNCLHLFLE